MQASTPPSALSLPAVAIAFPATIPRVSQPTPIPDFVPDHLARLEITLQTKAIDQLATYLALLLDVNQRMNLTAIRDPDAAWSRLIIDSLTILPGLEQLEPNAAVIDVGTGGGMPGIPIAIARPDLRVTLLDATGKKIAFVQSVIDTLKLTNATAIQGRAELLGQDPKHRERYDVATCRAMGAVANLLECCMPLVKTEGRVLAMKGPKAEEELEDAANAMDILGVGDLAAFDAYPQSFDNELVILSFLKDRPTPKAYPREPGLPKRSPL